MPVLTASPGGKWTDSMKGVSPCVDEYKECVTFLPRQYGCSTDFAYLLSHFYLVMTVT